MLFERPDGTPEDDPAVPIRRRRGPKLSEAQVRLWHDVLYRLLTTALGFSPADARRVMGHKVSRRWEWERQRDVAEAERRLGGIGGVIRELAGHGD